MNLNEAFPTRFLSAADLGGREVSVTIASAALETLGQGADQETKLVLGFEGKKKFMVLNKTNATMIANNLGTSETDQWLGRQITLGTDMVSYAGKTGPAIRVRPAGREPIGTPVPSLPPERAALKTTTKPKPGKDGQAFQQEEGADEDVPFNGALRLSA